MPFGYLISALLPALCVLAALAPRRSPHPLAAACFVLGFINELPFLAAYSLIASTLLAAAEGDLITPIGWVAFAIDLLALAGLVVLVVRALPTGEVLDRALAEQLAPPPRYGPPRYGPPRYGPPRYGPPRYGPAARVPVLPMLLWPFIRRRRDVRRTANIRYADERRNTLDLYRYRANGSARPVFVHLHGGAFAGGRKNQESLPLIYHLARQGWLCVSANYRLRPASRQDQLTDVGRVLGWVHANADRYGGDPTTVVLAGGSAGAYLAALATLTIDDPSVKATVMLYAYYGDLDAVDARPGTPPFLVVHGTNDTLIPVEAARYFAVQLRRTSPSPVVYAELPGAGHTFDIFHSPRSRAVVRGVATFLARIRVTA